MLAECEALDYHVPSAQDIRAAKAALAVLLPVVDKVLADYRVDPVCMVDKQEGFPFVVNAMLDAGWLYSGAGYFSAVFYKSGLAIKVGFKREDTGGAYAAWCRANQGQPGVPVIHAILSAGRCFVVLMDRCYSMGSMCVPEDNDYDPQLAEELAAAKVGLKDGINPYDFPSTATARKIGTYFDGLGHFDLHDKNAMLDRNGELVLTDPMSCHIATGYTYYDQS